ncbi:TonB-dependent receptor domain-containing protein [Parvularcula marina]|uniref:TonB-dependent receptor n=1 Tax=Parvularcula marina TaxID=2292771 RepID=A0A371RFX4_9PROT|nr:TonB-dependent receptor [Parvularcula marina]RFB04336.1 TonB-dependent receptor [Parvularcula marina]
MTNTYENDDLRRFAPGFRALLIGGASALAIAMTPAYAQDTSSDDVDTIDEADEDDSGDDKVVVTGSRLRSDTFTSISPLQVITTDDSLDVGLIDPAAILQQSEAAAGQQIDSTFQGFVLDNGPGSETINLRGLGASRTLILINGRRMAPAGVEGAPGQPSINLLPGSLIERYDLLLDGASSVYGSDAVAGVGNVILKRDFEGLELFASGDYNVEGAGHDYTLSAAWGKNTDRGFFGIGAEYEYTDEVTFADRDFLAGCDTHYEITESGQIRTIDVATALDYEDRTGGLVTSKTGPCKASGLAGRTFEAGSPAFGSAYFIDGFSNLNVGNFNESSLYSVPVDGDGDGIADVYFPDFALNGNDLETSLYPEQKQYSVMAYGEYTLEGEMNLTPFFEALWVRREVESDSGAPQLFPYVPANSPFNICNPAATAVGGTDCGLGEDSLLTNPNYIAAFQAYYNGGPGSANCFGLPAAACLPANFGLLNGPVGAIVTEPIVGVNGDRDNVEVSIEQLRLVGGVRGDLPFLNFGSLNDWGFETSLVYSRSDGKSSRMGIRDDRLAFALGWDPTVDFNGNGGTDDVATNNISTLVELPGGACDPTGAANPSALTAEITAGCVPVNLYAPSLYGQIQGDFATQAERDYIFDSRDFDTVVEQTLFNAFITGNVFELPAGDVGVVAGVEYRIDEIDSQPDNIAAQGLFFGFFSDLGAVGEKWTREAFFEVAVPVLANKPLVQSLDLTGSARWTEDEFYGSAWTYSVKGGWRPFDSLLVKGSIGTSFRAPNLRENFLLGSTGFNGVTDPCAVPDAAYNGITGMYDAGLDDRDQSILDNCIREGRDPTRVGTLPGDPNVIRTPSVEISNGGVTDISEETSNSYTAGFSFEQPWFESFDLNVGVSYYDIEIEDSIIEPGNQFIVNDCFTRQDGTRSPFCDRITYDPLSSMQRGLIATLDAGFINQDKETVTGLDYNLRFSKEFTAWDQPMDFGFNLRANQLKERETIFVGDDLTVAKSEFDGEFGFPEWTATGTFTLDVSDYRFTWQTRYIGDVSQDVDGIDEFSDGLDSQGTGFFGDTCAGPDFGDELCRDVGFADAWYEHAASIRYRGDTWTVRAGVSNVFDKAPPLVDSNEVFAISNTPIGNGYALDGREFFLTVSKDFN